jgi:hypothetical protein
MIPSTYPGADAVHEIAIIVFELHLLSILAEI